MEDPVILAQSTEQSSNSTRDSSVPPAPPMSQSQSQTRPDEIQESVRTSIEDVWYLKEIWFPGGENGQMRPYKIITQNFNGPCSFIAICNILILRGNIDILPPSRTSVSYEFLSQLVAEYLLLNSPDVDISMALSMMPLTTKGMDLNPIFSSPTVFRPSTSLSSLSVSSSSQPSSDGALELFEHAGIKLVHGWLVDPDSSEYETIKRLEDYDSAVNLIVEADVLTQGRLVVSEEALEGQASGSSGLSGPSGGTGQLSETERKKVQDAVEARAFLDSTQSQLTYHGLFTLASNSPAQTTIPPSSSHSTNPFVAADSGPGPSTSKNPFLTDPSTSNPFRTSDLPQAHREDVIPPNTLVALFRNSHLSVLYKHAPSSPPPSRPSPSSSSDLFASHVKAGSSPSTSSPPAPVLSQPAAAEYTNGSEERQSALYTLVTDQVFLNEPSVVWEKLEDVDQGAAVFVDAEFRRSTPMGGDWAGVRWDDQGAEANGGQNGIEDPDPDRALARRLQAEEDAYARQVQTRRLHQQQEAERQQQLERDWQRQYAERAQQSRREGGRKKKDCIIM